MTPGDDDTKSEQDVDEDNKVAASRAGKGGDEDGSYVGQTFNDESLDTGETGAEARSSEAGN